jgi:hypothetical protein
LRAARDDPFRTINHQPSTINHQRFPNARAD